jgi:hypothetical protein
MVSALGLILAVPLAALPASASLPGGGFFVKAQNKSTAGVQAIAGMGTKIVSDPSGGNTGDSRVFASYRCGALSFEVTKEMVDFSGQVGPAQVPLRWMGRDLSLRCICWQDETWLPSRWL